MTLTDPHITYRPRHPDELSWGCAVTAWGHGNIRPGEDYPKDGHPPDRMFTWENGRRLEVFQFIYLSKGRGEFESERSGHAGIGEGSVLLLFPGVWHRYRPEKTTGWEEWWVEFSGPVPDRLLADGFLDPDVPHYRVGDRPEIRRLLQELTRPAHSGKPEAPGIRPTLVLHLLSRLQAAGGEVSGPKERDAQKIHESTLLIRRQYHQSLDLQQIARDMGMSYTVWRRKFREIIGCPPRRFVLGCRIRSACNLLINSDRPIQDIGEDCGFESPQHFSRLFRKKTGRSPRKYREEKRSDRKGRS